MDVYELVRILTDQKSELGKVDVSALCPRKEESQFDLDSDLAQVVIGVRRSGKSMLCLKVLKESGKNFGYVDFDDEELIDLTKKNDCIASVCKVLTEREEEEIEVEAEQSVDQEPIDNTPIEN